MITATILFFVEGQVQICTTGPTKPVEKKSLVLFAAFTPLQIYPLLGN